MDRLKIKNAFIKKLNNGDCLYWASSAIDEKGNYTVVKGIYGKEPERLIYNSSDFNKVMFDEVLSKGYTDTKSMEKNELKELIENITNALCEKKERIEAAKQEVNDIKKEYKKWSAVLPYGEGL